MDAAARPPLSVETKPVLPLLPAILTAPASFLWLWVLPVAVMDLLNLQGYWIVEENMEPLQRESAFWIGAAGLVNLLVGLGCFFAGRHRRHRDDHPAWGIPGILLQVAYLWLAVSSLQDGLLPRSVTAWIYPEPRFLFNQFAFAMLPLFHGVLRLAGARAPVHEGRAILFNLGLAIGGPVLLYLIFSGWSYLASYRNPPWLLIVTTVVALGLVMFLGLVRGLMLLLRVTQRWNVTGERWAVILFALAFPTGGLLLNRNIPFPVDFQATEVYVMTFLNALVLLFAAWRPQARPILNWSLLCGTLPFSLYFFIVFLPYTPLSILAVIALGTGLLVLTPTFLFALHVHLLVKASRRAGETSGCRRVRWAGILAFLVLPAFFVIRGLADKSALNTALDYVYEPTIAAGDVSYPGNLANTRRAIASHRAYKDGLYYPLLSDFYAWLVFDNLVLPDDKLKRLEETFLDAPADQKTDLYRQGGEFWGRGRAGDRKRVWRGPPPARTVVAKNVTMSAARAAESGTTVTLAISLQNTAPSGAAEYVDNLPVPAGVVVTGFRLQVGDTLVPGRIFEKKTALWVYEMIRDTERRDPGLLFYRTPAELELRVFPVNSGKPVAVEIDFLVPAKPPGDFLEQTWARPADALAALREHVVFTRVGDAAGGTTFFGLDGLALPAGERPRFFHLIVDRSAATGFEGDLAPVLATLTKSYPTVKEARVTLANFETVDLLPWKGPLKVAAEVTEAQMRARLPLAGGLVLEPVLARALRWHRDFDLHAKSLDDGREPQPLFVIVSRQPTARSVAGSLLEAWSDVVPGLEVVAIDAQGGLTTLSKDTVTPRPFVRFGGELRPVVPDRPVRFSSSSPEPLEYWSPGSRAWRPVAVAPREPAPAWRDAVVLQLRQQDQSRDPGGSVLDLKSLVQASRERGVLLPSTSYIVVENTAQWRMLELGEKQKLDQNSALEFTETPAPPELWIAGAFGGWLWLRRRSRRLAQAA